MFEKIYIKFLPIAIIILNPFVAYGEILLEDSFTHSTDLFQKHEFIANPAVYKADKLTVSSSVALKNGKSEFNEERNNSISEIKSDVDKFNFGAGLTGKYDSFMSYGFNFQYSSTNVKTKSSEVDESSKESHKYFYASPRLAIHLVDRLRFGLNLRVLHQSHEIIGNIRTDEKTSFSTILIGTGGGIVFDADFWKLGASYILPIKGKSEIKKEELIVSEPGSSEFTFAIQETPYRAGFTYLRYIYRTDERGAGSSLDNANNTNIDLFGLNIDDNIVRSLSYYMIGGDYLINKDSLVRGSVIRQEYEFNFDLNKNIPGQNSDTERNNKYILKIEYQGKLALFDYTGGFIQSKTSHNFDANRASFEYKSTYFGFYGSIFKNL